MAVVNIYKFYGKSTTSADSNVALLSPAVNETFIIKSIRVTNSNGNDEINKTNGIDSQPNQKPIAANNFASPSPIPSLFLTFL